MARRRASMREGPLAELFRATEAAQRQAEREERGEEPVSSDPQAATVEHAAPVEGARTEPARGRALGADARRSARARA